MTKTEMKIKLKELEADVLRLRLEVARLEREVRNRPYVPYFPQHPIQPHEHPWAPRIRYEVGDIPITPDVSFCGGFVDPNRAKLRVGGS